MQKLLTYLQKDWVIVLLLMLVTIPAVKTLFFVGYFPHHDDLQVMRILEVEKCFKDGQIPCRWVPDMGYGYGYPLFNFYPPLPFYLGALEQTVTHLQLIDTVKISFIVQFLVALIFMYLFARQWWGKVGGAVSAVFYTYAPYHAVDLYVRGALDEAFAMAFAPAVGWALTRLSRRQSVFNVILVALAFSGMLLSHNLMVLIFTPLFALFALFLLLTNRSWRLFFSMVASAALSVALCAFFSIPVLLEQKYAHVDTLFSGYFNYSQHFVTLHQLFFSRFWGYGGSVYGPYDGLAFPVGTIHWIGVLAVMVAALWFLYKRNFKVVGLLAIFVAYFWFSAFMTHQKSTPIYLHIPVFQELQFPWRFLSTVTFTSSFIVGSLFLLPIRKSGVITLCIGLIVTVFLLNIDFFHKEYVIHITDQQKLSGQLWQLQQTAGIFDYLPIYAVAPPGRAANGNYQILSGNPTISNLASGSASLRFNYSSPTDSTIRLNIFDFPIWKVFIDGKQTPINHNNYLDLITFSAPAGNHTVLAKFTNTPIRTVTDIISALAIVGTVAALIWQGALAIKRRQKTQP